MEIGDRSPRPAQGAGLRLDSRRKRRRFFWASSVTGPSGELERLDRDMAAFYALSATRARYQAVADSDFALQPLTEKRFREVILRRNPQSILEVGCGSGRIYEGLRHDGFGGAYCGLEMSADVVANNRVTHKDGKWIHGSIYDVGFELGTFDLVAAYFVLEHCVYPLRALNRMAGLLADGGALVLVFPDFVEMGRFASQTLGFSDGNAKHHLRRGDLLSALLGLYESRVRLARALKHAVEAYGPFPVNLNPRCLSEPPECFQPDFDAVYISSKAEVSGWARDQGMYVSYPAGTSQQFRENALIEISQKPRAQDREC